MADKLPQMWIVALEVLDEGGLWQTAHTWYCGENIDPIVRTGMHQGKGGVKTLVTQTIEAPPSLNDIKEEAEGLMQEWLEAFEKAGVKNGRIRLVKAPLRGKGRDINSEEDE